MATLSNTQCPWKNFYRHTIKYMDSLPAETCQPQMKITKFITAARHHFFASPTMNLAKDKKSTKQLKGSKKSKKQSKMMVQDTKGRTSNSDTDDTDSAYSTESESNHIEHLPRPSCSPRPTRQHLQPCSNKSQQFMNTTCIQGTRPSCIPIPKHTKSIKNSHLSTLTDLPKPSTSTPPNIQTTMKQPTLPTPRTATASTNQQKQPIQVHAHHPWTRKVPLLPTPPVSARHFNYRNYYKQHIPGPSPSRYNIYSTFLGPATLNNYRYLLQPHISGTHTAYPPYLHQSFITRPYQQPQGHHTQQVSLSPYVPIIILTPYNQINSILAHQTSLFNPNQYQWTSGTPAGRHEWSKKIEKHRSI